MREEIIGDCRLIHGDCLEILQTVSGFDAIVTDPPYGQKYKVNTFYKGWTRDSAVIQRNGKTLMVCPSLYEEVKGDDIPFDPAPLLGLADEVMIWGAHKFADRLPVGSWLVWDKVPTGKIRDQGDGEAAWFNKKQPLRIFRLLWDGLCVGKGARHEVTAGQKRLHPFQKPEALMVWCLSFIKGKVIFDPYMGSGTTGIACIKAGKGFIGIEDSEQHFETACRRIEKAYKNRPRLFDTLKPELRARP